MVVTEEKISACVAHFKGQLDRLPRSPRALSKAPDSRVRSILRRAGAQRRSDALMQRLADAFEAAGVLTHPALTDPGLSSEDRIFMLDARHPIEGLTSARQLFRAEASLEDFIFANQDLFAAFARLGLTEFQRQVRLGSGRRVDLMSTRPKLNQLVGIELKLREPDDRATGQLQQYLDDLADEAANQGYNSAHLIVITGQPDRSVKDRVEAYAKSKDMTVAFMLYRVQLDLIKHP